MGIPTLKFWHFEASEDIITKFATLWNIGILLYKQATRTKHFDGLCTFFSPYTLESGINIPLHLLSF